MKLSWLIRAITDRDSQIDYIARDNPKAATEQGDRIAHQVSQLLEHPEMGRSGRQEGTRELVISRTHFLVVYRIKGERIEIIRLLHGFQKFTA